MAPYSISISTTQTTVTVVELIGSTSATTTSSAIFSSDIPSSQSTTLQSTSQLSDLTQTAHTTNPSDLKTSTTSIRQTPSRSSHIPSASSSPTPGSNHAGAVAGGVIGGTAMLGLLGALLYFCCRKKFRVRLKVRRETEEKDEDKKRDLLLARRLSMQPGSKDGDRDVYSDPGGFHASQSLSDTNGERPFSELWGSPAIVSYDPSISARKPSPSIALDQQVRPLSELPYDYSPKQRAELAQDPVRDPINPIQTKKKTPRIRFSMSPRNNPTTSISSSEDNTVSIASASGSAQVSASSAAENSLVFLSRSQQPSSWTATDGVTMRGNFDSSHESLGKGGLSPLARHAMSWTEYEAVPTEELARKLTYRKQ
ncbi:MAG: hypothetical protein Q9160_003799 [Pyrenula sp. 1 TL-2023]